MATIFSKQEMSIIPYIVFFMTFSMSCVMGEDIALSKDDVSCEEVCSNSFTLHTYPESEHLSSCFRGCRLFSIIDTVEEYNDLNATRDCCYSSCNDCYGEDSGKFDACKIGCNAQQPLFSPLEQYLISQIGEMFRPPSFDPGMFFPFLYARGDSFSNMVEKIGVRTRVSWSFYMQNDDGKMIIVRSEPSDYENFDLGEMTENYMETNIEPMDGSATPNLPHSPFFAVKSSNLHDRNLELSEQETMTNGDWLTCISRKTGLPRIFLVFTIFLSAMGMIWLAITTTVTASEHRVTRQPELLSYYGDLEYLKQSGTMTKVEPIGPGVQAPPLPIKLKVQEI